MPAKFDRCVRKVKASLKRRRRSGNAYAICTAALRRSNPLLVIVGAAAVVGTAIVLTSKKAAAATPSGVVTLQPNHRYAVIITGQTQTIDPALAAQLQQAFDARWGVGVVKNVSISQTGGAGSPVTIGFDYYGQPRDVSELKTGEFAQAQVQDLGSV